MSIIVAVIGVVLPILIVGLFCIFYIFERWSGTRTAISSLGRNFMYRCRQCNSERIRRSKRRGFVERVPLTLLFLRPFHCGDCKHRFVRLPMVGARARFNAIRAKLFTSAELL
jgi:hypothetical protein